MRLKLLLLLCVCHTSLAHSQEKKELYIHFYDTIIDVPFVKSVEPAINGWYTVPETALRELPKQQHYTLIYPYKQISANTALQITTFQDSLSTTIQPGALYADMKRLGDSLSREAYLRRQAEKTRPPEIQPDPDPTPINGILDGVYIKEVIPHIDPNTVLPKHYVKYDSQVTVYSRSTKLLDDHRKSFQPKVDQLLQPFYMANHEVTNKEYRAFVYWVRDSVALSMLYGGLQDDNAALSLLNCTKKEQKQLDPAKRAENLAKYGLNHDLCYGKNAIFTNEDYLKWLEYNGFYKPKAERFYHRLEIELGNLNYDYGADSPTPVYPDTLCWLRDYPVSILDTYTNMYFWHPAYNNYPVVGLSLAQMKAYCDWLQRRVPEGLTVSLPTLYHYEMALKACMIPEQKALVNVDQRSFAAYERSLEKMLHFILPIGILPEHFKQIAPNNFVYNWFRTYQTQPITDLTGSVSEIINATVPNEMATDSMYTIGGNWSMYVTDAKEEPYNTTFYRQTVPLSGNSTTGFRIVLIPCESVRAKK